jgi:TPR repeat protein
MKKLLLITLALASHFVNAQNIQAYSDATIDGRGFSYNVQLSITPLENNEVTQSGGWIVKIISVNPDSKGYYHKGKTDRYFSCSELGSICNPSKFNVILVKVKYQCENNAEKLITFYGLDREQTIVVRQKPNTKCNIELESVTVRNNTDGDIYHKRINELEYPQQNTSTTNNNLPSSNYSNPIAKENKQTSTGMPANTSGNDPLANYNNNSAQNSSFEKGYQQGQQIVNVATDVIDLFSPTPAQIQRRAEEQKQREKAEIVAQDNQNKAVRYFKTELDKYLVAAENGDEKARMRLYFETRQYFRLYKYSVEYMIPKAEEWLIEAAKNKNNFAMNIIGFNAIYFRSWQKYGYNVENFGYNNEQGMLLLEESASLGSLDAMMTLAKYYNRKGKDYGSNAEKAFYYYSEASKKGSPTAMLHLGNIYRDQNTDYGGVKYKSIPKNNAIAFSWFCKSAACTGFKETAFGELGFENGSKFEGKVYDELSTMFEKGLGVKKDKAIAEKFDKAYWDYISPNNANYRIPSQKLYDDYLAPINTNRWGDNPQDNATNPIKSDNANSTNNTINLLKSGNTNSVNNTKTNTTTPITETSTLDEKAEYNKAKIDYKAGTISKDAYKEAIKKYGAYAGFESKRLQKAYQNKEITYSEYNQALKILLRK